ncbi:D-alanine--D-alanine ligase [Ectothiorhodospiraceae bacterium WFHF3C12]|nr:D-alanine--D-alanine ligase [Ectothiorhodospiraceae bacterium WFHF3C12]
MKNIFVVGLDPFNRALLETIEPQGAYAFHELLGYAEAVRPPDGRYAPFNELLARAEERLAQFPGSVDAIIGYWDFPSGTLAPLLAHHRGLPGPSPTAVARCEHKLWARRLQAEVLPDLVPRFQALDPFAPDPLATLSLPFPFWIKPVKAHSSYLGFHVSDADDLERALSAIRAGIGVLGPLFDAFLEHVDLPDDVAGIGGHHCIVEEDIALGQQCTLEGYACGGRVTTLGVVDSIRGGEQRSSFTRYQYPSHLPESVVQRMCDATERLVRHLGYDQAPFNVEFYWDSETDRMSLLEINARISKSHAPLFRLVDGAVHQQVLTELALGRRPDYPHRQGEWPLAAKFMIRHYHNGVISRVPTAAALARLHERCPEALVRLLVRQGQRLDELQFQDSYSYELAELFLGARTRRELLSKYRFARRRLRFGIQPLTDATATDRPGGAHRDLAVVPLWTRL